MRAIEVLPGVERAQSIKASVKRNNECKFQRSPLLLHCVYSQLHVRGVQTPPHCCQQPQMHGGSQHWYLITDGMITGVEHFSKNPILVCGYVTYFSLIMNSARCKA